MHCAHRQAIVTRLHGSRAIYFMLLYKSTQGEMGTFREIPAANKERLDKSNNMETTYCRALVSQQGRQMGGGKVLRDKSKQTIYCE